MSERIQQAIKRLAGNGPRLILACEVTALDLVAATCNARPLDEREPELFDVKLNLEGRQCVFFPKVGSHIAVAMLDEHEAVMVTFGELEQAYISVGQRSIEINANAVVLNGGSKKGMIELDKLILEINKLNQNFEMLKNAVSSAPIVPADGGASLKAALTTAVNSFQSADILNTENKLVLQ